MKIQFPAQITKVETTPDRGLRIKMVTPELSPEEKAILFGYGEAQFYAALVEIAITAIDIPDFIPVFKEEKSPAKRLKNVLYRLWEQKTDRTRSSDQFYRDYMEKVINQIKEKLD